MHTPAPTYRSLVPSRENPRRHALHDGSGSPHTCGVRLAPCGSFATEPCRPTACIERATPTPSPLTANSKLLTPNWFYTIDAKNNAVTVLKDGLGLQVLTVAPMNTVTHFEYNAIGQLKKSTDPDGFETEYWYDQFGRMTHRKHPDAGDDWYMYDPSGNLTRHTNAAGEHLDYSYHYNQLTDIICSEYPGNNIHYEYGTSSDANINAVGKVVLQEDASGWQTFSYGKLGELVENNRTFALPFDNQTYTFKMQYEYDSYNRMRRMTYPDGEVVSYDYNRGGMLNSITGVKNGVTYKYLDSIRYNEFELREAVWYGNGTHTHYLYDSLQRLSRLRSYSIQSAGPDEMMQDINYSYDAVSNITGIANNAGMLSNGLGGTYSTQYMYNNLYRLTTAEGSWTGNSSLYFLNTMSYFKNGRILRKTMRDTPENEAVDVPAVIHDYHYDNANQPNTLTSIDNSCNQDFDWDLKGNMIYHHNDEAPFVRLFCWDEQNRLMGVADNQNLSLYLYDASGERAYKFTGAYTSQNISGQWRYFYYMDKATLYASPFLVATPQGYTKHYYAENERVASRIGGGGLSLLDTAMDHKLFEEHWELSNQLFEQTADCLEAPYELGEAPLGSLYNWVDTVQQHEDECYWYHPDHLGSSSWITDKGGHAVQHLHYLPWGEDYVNQRTTDFSSRYTFSSKERDSETGLSYFGSRYYSSDLSIWLSVDPMSDKYPSLSPYVYCRNNPLVLVDPNGMWDAEINENGTCVMFRAEDGDDLHSLAIQLGISIEDLSDYEGTTFEAGQLYSLDKIDKVKDINKAIALMNNENYNCANFAMFSNGILQEPAFVNDDGTSSLDNAALMIDSRFSNVSEANTCIGDVVTFGYTEWALRRENNFQDVSELYTPKYTDTPGHYGVVLLKSKDGMSVQKIIEKPGSHAIKLNDYNNYQGVFFTPRPKTNGSTPFYKLR